MMRKYGGIRVHWNGTHLVLQNGKSILVPSSLSFPALPMDLEIFSQSCDHTMKIVEESNEEQWKEIKFMVLDTPSSMNYRDRLQLVRSVTTNYPWISTPDVKVCQGSQDLLQFQRISTFY